MMNRTPLMLKYHIAFHVPKVEQAFNCIEIDSELRFVDIPSAVDEHSLKWTLVDLLDEYVDTFTIAQSVMGSILRVIRCEPYTTFQLECAVNNAVHTLYKYERHNHSRSEWEGALILTKNYPERKPAPLRQYIRDWSDL